MMPGEQDDQLERTRIHQDGGSSTTGLLAGSDPGACACAARGGCRGVRRAVPSVCIGDWDLAGRRRV